MVQFTAEKQPSDAEKESCSARARQAGAMMWKMGVSVFLQSGIKGHMRSSIGGTGSQLVTILMFVVHIFLFFSPPLSSHFLKNVLLFYSGGTSSLSTVMHKSTAIRDRVVMTMERPTRWKCAWIPRRQKWRKHTGHLHCNSTSCYYRVFLFFFFLNYYYLQVFVQNRKRFCIFEMGCFLSHCFLV